jgi:hypothetical protein
MNRPRLPATPRQRAPRRAGHRTQLTVPEELWAAAEKMAADLGTTPNDVVVRLATTGLTWAQRRDAHDAIAAERWRAYQAALPEPTGEFPSEEELVQAVLDDED